MNERKSDNNFLTIKNIHQSSESPLQTSMEKVRKLVKLNKMFEHMNNNPSPNKEENISIEKEKKDENKCKENENQDLDAAVEELEHNLTLKPSNSTYL